MAGQLGGDQVPLMHAPAAGGKQALALAGFQSGGVSREIFPHWSLECITRPPLLHLDWQRMTNSLRSSFARCRRPVIKIGSAVLAGAGGKAGPPTLDRQKFAGLCDDLAAIARGRTPVVVSSGAVALAAMVVDLVEADLLVILTDAAGVCGTDPRKDPSAQRISHLERITPEVEALAGEARSSMGSGGMLTKLRAARRASEAGVPCAIVPGEPGILPKLLQGDDVGTVVSAQGERRGLRKRWMLDLKARGELRVDDGARLALTERKKSLLPSGVREVLGSFASGDPVQISTLDGTPFARGLAVYSADEVRRIVGRRSAEIEAALGYRLLDCVVHRDDLVVMQ